ncbi:AIPR family protein [Bradyrhizobium sp. USDA 4451]
MDDEVVDEILGCLGFGQALDQATNRIPAGSEDQIRLETRRISAEASDITSVYSDFWEDMFLEADSSASPQPEAFFQLYSRVATLTGECTDLTYSPAKKEGRGGYQVDGYAFEAETGELYLAVCDFRNGSEIETLNAGQVEVLIQRVKSFLERCIMPDFVENLAQTNPALEAAYSVHSNYQTIRRIRIVIFSNARLATRRPPEATGEIIDRPAVFSVLDLARYDGIKKSKGQVEPIEIDLAELNGSALPSLRAHSGAGDYSAFLVAMPGSLLAKIYSLYGSRLLEQNVRTFLQAKTKVNRGIIQTIVANPKRFFAYNNGITATASSLETARLNDGSLAIRSIRNLQIVNGGQTTASILYAKDRSGADLGDIWVPMKLSVVEPGYLEEMVPKISRYANTQNKINEADFFSSHPLHLKLEQISRRLMAPPKPGFLSGSKWFYERARGQYNDYLVYETSAARTRFEQEYPKDQRIDKTELGKFELTFLCQPNVVSLGEQKCFIEFAEYVGKKWEEDEASFDDEWFKRAAAKALVFRWTDRMVATSDWYKSDRGFKAQIVMYSIAWLVSYLARIRRSEISLEVIWNAQSISADFGNGLLEVARQVARKIKEAPPSVKNIVEYCKQEACWNAVSKADFVVPQQLGPEVRRISGPLSRKTLPTDDSKSYRPSTTIVERDDAILYLRQLVDGGANDREGLIAGLARLSGFERVGSRAREEMANVVRTGVRRRILKSNGEQISVGARTISEYDRDFLKDQFLASMQGRSWTERSESIRAFARWLGFRRTGPYIEEAAKSLINGLIREGRLESEGSEIRRKG